MFAGLHSARDGNDGPFPCGNPGRWLMGAVRACGRAEEIAGGWMGHGKRINVVVAVVVAPSLGLCTGLSTQTPSIQVFSQ